MTNAIIINGATYELVPNDTDEMVCESCALRDICMSVFAFSLCVQVHNAEYKDHYVKRQKGGET
jgi:hypothetical protein